MQVSICEPIKCSNTTKLQKWWMCFLLLSIPLPQSQDSGLLMLCLQTHFGLTLWTPHGFSPLYSDCRCTDFFLELPTFKELMVECGLHSPRSHSFLQKNLSVFSQMTCRSGFSRECYLIHMP